jgi:hypothetical protein
MVEKKKVSMKALNERYTQRITYAKQGNIAAKEGNIRNALKFYNMYLKILADVKGVEGIDELSPKLFNKDIELPEMLLISHIHWDLCKIFDISPHLEAEFQKNLFKFVEFTEGNKFQVVNAEMLRRHIKRDRHKHKKEFKEAYRRIYIASKKCYIATHCFGETHPKTQSLRIFKNCIVNFELGRLFVDFYYYLSPTIVMYCNKHRIFNFILTQFIFIPILFLFAEFVDLIILMNRKLSFNFKK